MPSSIVTLHDIAAKLNLSVSTISFGMRNAGTISKETCELIQRTAKEMGYVPSPMLSALSRLNRRTKRHPHGTPIGLISLNPRVNGAKIIETTKYARHKGYDLRFLSHESLTNGPAASKRLYAQGFQGLIIETAIESLALPSLDWSKFCVVTVGQSFNRLPFHASRQNVFQSVFLSWEKLRAKGYRRIGLAPAQHPRPILEDFERHGAALACMHSTPARYRIPPLLDSDLNDHEAVVRWAKKYRPEAVVVFHGGIYWYLKEAGFRIPETLGLALLEIVSSTAPITLSGTRSILDAELRNAVDLLDDAIQHHERGEMQNPRTILAGPEWIEGNSAPGPAGN